MTRISRKKRLLLVVLAILMVVSILPPQIIAVDGYDKDTSVIGKTAKITSAFPVLWKDPTNNDPALQVSPLGGSLPALVKIVDVHQYSSTITLYKLDAADGYTWPEEYKDYRWIESTKVAFVEVCDKCGGVNCDKVHVFCPYCDTYDCPLEHNDPYQPYVAPVIPENPTLTPGADVSLVDEYGDPVTEGLVVEPGKKYSLSAWPNLSGEVIYQWQVCYNNAKMLWVDIYGQTGKGILASSTMFSSLVDAQGMTYLRCVTTNGSQTMYSEPIAVFVMETALEETKISTYNSLRNVRSTASGEGDGVQTVDEELKYTITVEYIVQVAGAETPSADVFHVTPGATYPLNVTPRPMTGFYAGDAAGNPIDVLNETIVNIQSDLNYKIYYWPDYVDYKIEHYQQRIGEDKYDLVLTELIDGDGTDIRRKKTGKEVGDALAKTYTGFAALPYDYTITMAADGSTVVKIYYDRQHYMIAIDLDGGYGAEPVYARYETPVTIPTPKRIGYAFAGWWNENENKKVDNISITVPAYRMDYTARWKVANTKFTVLFWYENAENEEYTFVGSKQMDGTTDQIVDGTKDTYTSLNKVDSADHYDGFKADYAQHFTTLNADKTDKAVTIKADGSSVVNVYYYRNKYQLAYYRWNCVHDHSSGCTYCSTTEHTHTTGCIAHGLTAASGTNQNWLNNNTSNRYDGMLKDRNSAHYVYFGGTWYRKSGLANEFDEIEWNCNGTGGQMSRHTHSASCCTHDDKYDNCTCRTNGTGWIELYNRLRKYEEDVSATHKTMQNKTTGYRWVDMYFGGKETGENYGGGGAMGTFTSMPGGKTIFYEGEYRSGDTLFEMQYWLETYEGDPNATRYYDKKWFKKQGEPFYTRMSFVGWNGDYMQGLPAGYEHLDATFGDSPDGGGLEDPYKNSLKNAKGDGYTQRSYKKYNNFYYVRKEYPLAYNNYGQEIPSVNLKYEQPIDSSFRLPVGDLVSPFGPGYEFAGWYLDEARSVEYRFDGSITMPLGGFMLYAKWDPINHTVTTYAKKEDIGGSSINAYQIHHGDTFANAYQGQTVPIPENGSLTFIGWFYEEDGKEVAYDFSMPVYRNMNLYGKWSSSVVTWGTIYYEDANGNELAKPEQVFGMVGDTKTFSAKLSTEFGDGTKLYFPDSISHNIKFSDTPEQNTHTFVYTALPDVEYSIRFVDKNNPTKDLLPALTGLKASKATTDIHYAPTIENYYVDKNSKQFALSSDPGLNVFYFYYTYDPGKANVQVIHYIESLDGTRYEYFSESQPEVLEKKTTTIVAADRALQINGFTYSFAKFNGVIDDDGRQVLEDSLTLELYYTRNSYDYTFQFLYQDENDNWVAFDGSEVKGKAKFRDSIIQNAKTFKGYKPDAGAKSVLVENDASLNIVKFYYSEETVDISYRVGAVKGGSISSTIDNDVPVITGNPLGSKATVNNNGYYYFTGWYTDYNCTQRVSEDYHFVPQKTGNYYVAQIYYAGFAEVEAKINYQVVMPNGAPNATLDKTSEQVYILTGTAIGSSVATIPEGYVFAGWYSDEACTQLVSTKLNFVPQRPGQWEESQTYYAKFEKGKFTVTWVDGFGNTLGIKTFEYGETVSGIDAPTKEGHTFTGWNKELPATMPAENLVITAQWTVNKYTVTWIVDGVETTETYAYGELIVKPTDPSKEGYRFAGWKGHTDGMEMPAENLTFTAVWHVDIIATINNSGTIDVAFGSINHTGKVGEFSLCLVPVGSVPGATLTFKPAEGYRIISVTINGEPVDASLFTEGEYKYTVSEEGITGPLNIVVTTALKTTALTIRVNGCAAIDVEQSFILKVKSNTAGENVDLNVVIHENGAATIEGLVIGNSYTVTMENWSWRYKADTATYAGSAPAVSNNVVTIEMVAGGTLQINVVRTNNYWLDGNHFYPPSSN